MVKRILSWINLAIHSILLFPHWIFYNWHGNSKVLKYETQRWLKILRIEKGTQTGFIFLMAHYPEFRNLFYYRTRPYSRLFRLLCPPMSSILILSNNIGPGLFLQHGISTIIAANSIGKDCWINQQVTIGFSNETDCPTILDNVTISAGAKVIGNIVLGNNVQVGANAVVVKTVPDNCTVVGIPAYIIKRNGVKVREEL